MACHKKTANMFMKYRIFALALLSILGWHDLRASMSLTFDWSQLGNPSLDADNIYVTFAGQSSDMLIGGALNEAINFNANAISYTINGTPTNFGTSKSYTLNQVITNGLTINTATSITAFLSYGSNAGFGMLGAGQNPDFHSPSLGRYSQFEFTYTVGGDGGINMTQISQFGGAIQIQTQNATHAVQAHIGNSANQSSGDMLRALAAASGGNPAAVYMNNGEYTRVIGSNVFTSNNPYQPFNGYLEALDNAGNGTALPHQIKNLAPGAPSGGEGAIGIQSTPNGTIRVTGNTTYNIDYEYSAQITRTANASVDFPHGTFSVLLTGNVHATPALGGNTITYTGATILIGEDKVGNASMTNFLYLQSLSNPSVNATLSGWADLIDDYGASNVMAAIQEKIAGDFGQALVAGFPESDTQVLKGNSTVNLGSLTTYEWFNIYNQYAYSLAQPSDPGYYNQYANVIYRNSPGGETQSNPSQVGYGEFDHGSVYGTPFDDRFGLNLISTDSETEFLHVTFLPDGSLVPEPEILALMGLGAGFFLLLRGRRRFPG